MSNTSEVPDLESPKASNIVQPGQVIKPILNIAMVEQLISTVFGLKATKIKELNGYDDKNYFVEVDEKHSNPHIDKLHPDGYVFKVLNSMDSKTPNLIDAHNEMMLHMHRKGFNVSIPVKNLGGQYKSLENIGAQSNGDDAWHIVRLLEFLPGQLLLNTPCTNEIVFKIGKYVALFDRALQDFHHPFYDNHQFIWMVNNAPEVKKFAFAVKDDEFRQMVLDTLDEFEKQVLSVMDQLPKAMIHGDINEQNILLRKVGSDPSATYEVHGVLDFGDSQFNCRIFEMVLATTYIMIQGTDNNFLELGGHTLAGYASVEKISSLEWDILKTCIETRYCQSLVMGAYTNSQQPSNTYVLSTAKNGWRQFRILRSMSREQLRDIWEAAIQKYTK